MLRAAIGSALFAFILTLAPAALAADSWEKEFQQGMAKPESWNKYAAVTKLDSSIPKAREYLYSILGKENWYLRSGAIESLKNASGDAIDDLKKQLKSHSSPLVREGLAYAFGRMGAPDRAEDLGGALEDKHELVRRAAAIAIKAYPVKAAVEGLLDAWGKEKQQDNFIYYREALEAITGKFLGARLDDWKAWWLAVKESWSGGKGDAKPDPQGGGEGEGEKKKEKSEEEKKAEEEGKKSSSETTQLRDVELQFKEAGRGGPLFILPEYGYGHEYLEKPMLAVGNVCRLFYIDLPGVSKFKNLPPGETGLPEYPIDKLCDAFDELRKIRKQERIAIMGHGMAAWVAMHYATKYPKNVSHLILVSTWTSGDMWGKSYDLARGFCKQNGDIEGEHCCMNHFVNSQTHKANYEPTSDDDGECLQRAEWASYFNDTRSSQLFLFWPKVNRLKEMGGVQIPKFNVGKEKGNPVPTLLVYGTSPRAKWTSPDDMKTLAKYYPNCEPVPCANSNRMPMVEDYDTFMKSVRGFFKKYPFSKKAKQQKS